ncbi:unnamed protein product [Ranitomeya imitator]|uniref:Protein FAM168A n=1 Tax=Ranitomeya imitator TaxID=111125 RepID=A0ABN9LVZ7_9NEOB|nr:unnamed protein product [Ranitomeya imitator]
MYPIRSAYPQQNLYAQGAYYTQPVYAAQPHVIHHTTVVQPNSIPSAIYPAPVTAPRSNGVTMGMVAGTTMAMSAGTLLTTPQHTAIGAHPVSVPTYRAQGTPAYSYVWSKTLYANCSSLTSVLERPANGTKFVYKNKTTKHESATA